MKRAHYLMTIVLAAAPAWAAAPQPSYTLTPLGLANSPGCESTGQATPFATAINEAGQVTGVYCFRASGAQHGVARGFFWSPQRGAVDLGLPLGVTNSATRVFPAGINGRGEVVGEALGPNGSFIDAFLWNQRTGMSVIAADAVANSINARSEVVGNLYKTNHAFLFSRGKVTDLGTIPGAINSRAHDINDGGLIAAEADVPIPGPKAFNTPVLLWTGRHWRSLGVPAGAISAVPSGINNLDKIVGTATLPTPSRIQFITRGFLWDSKFTILPCPLSGALPSCAALAINDASTIVGFAFGGAAVWFTGAAFDLNSLIDPRDPLRGKVALDEATSINGQGDITAFGRYVSGAHVGESESFVLSSVK